MADTRSWLHRIQALLDDRGWRSEADLTRLTRFVHFWVLLSRSFVRNRCPIRASALSYATLLALIPLLAVVISVSSSLLNEQGEKGIYVLVDQAVAQLLPQPQAGLRPPPPVQDPTTTGATPATGLPVLGPPDPNQITAPPPPLLPAAQGQDDQVSAARREVSQKIHEFIANTRSGVLGVTGMILLLLVGIRMLGSIESTFNDIWGVTLGRNWLSRIQIYCTAMLLGPLLLTCAAALAGGTHLQALRGVVEPLPLVGGLIFPFLTLLVLWLAFALFYQLVPHTKVNFGAAMIGGMVAGTLWHLNNAFGYLFASRVVTDSEIYGRLFIVPVFMAGLYLTWLILLFGAQVAYAFQNRTLYLQEKIAENVNQRGREFVALRLLTCIGQRFQRGLSPATIDQMSAELAIPSRLVQQVLQTLIAAHLVAETHGAQPAYTPARPLEQINAHHVLQAMRATNGQELVTRDEPVREEVYGEFARIQEAEKRAASSLSLLALVERAQARLEWVPPQNEPEELKMKPALVPRIEPVVPADEGADPGPPKVALTDLIPPPPPPPAGPPEAAPLPSHGESPPSAPANTVAIPDDQDRDFPL